MSESSPEADFIEVRGQGMVLGPPKSRAGLRTVALPGALVARLAEHLAEFVLPEPTALVFTGPKGGPIRRSNFNPLVGWLEAARPVPVWRTGPNSLGLQRFSRVERVTGIEPALSAWQEFLSSRVSVSCNDIGGLS
jgi:hypothetical protein